MNYGVLSKKTKNVDPCRSNRSKEGDAWIYTCIKRNTYFFVAFSVGKWTQETCGRMIEELSERTEQPSPQTKIEVFTDGNDDYTYVLPDYYADTCIDYGQLVKIRENGKVVRKEKRIIYGNPDPGDIETTDVENYNGILRERIGRLVRKTKCFSKRRWRLECSLQVFQFYWNFINEFKRRKSPAMLEGLTDHLWTWHEFIYCSLTISN